MKEMLEDALKNRLERDLTPSGEVKERIWGNIQNRMNNGEVMEGVKQGLVPSESTKMRVWARILNRIEQKESIDILEKLKVLLTPPPELGLHLKQRFGQSQAVPVPVRHTTFKWVAAAVVIALFVKAGPGIFLAPKLEAMDAVMLMPTRGEVTVSVGKLWQPVDELIELEPGTMLRTHEGEASIVFRDDSVIRLAPWTTVQVHDTQDPANDGDSSATLTLITGSIWVQGLIPSPLKGVRVRTDFGLVTVNEGSVSIVEGDKVAVKVWDRRARIQRGDSDIHLVAGERTELYEKENILVKKIPEAHYEERWANQNLDRDAVHRRSIAQLQRERRVAKAGILPTSILYPAKRIAEKMDELLTFGEEAKTQKKLDHAGARLDEAVALLDKGKEVEVQISLEEYRDSLLAAASGSGDALIRSLIDQSLAAEASALAAVLPNDDTYLIKQAILEVSASIPDGSVSSADVEGVLVVDTITAFIEKLDQEGAKELEVVWIDLSDHLTVLSSDESDLRPEVRKEAQMLLSEFAFSLKEISAKGGAVDPTILEEVGVYLPPETDSVPVLSEEQVMEIVQGIRDRIFVFHMARSRINQLKAEFKALAGHPDQGRILRKLRFVIPDGPEEFPLMVRKEIIRLQWERAA